MPDPTINGSGEATLNREQISFTPNVGGTYGGRYEGPWAKVREKIDTLIAAGYHIEYECDASPVATLTFTTATSGDPGGGGGPPTPNLDYTDSFSVLRNTVQKELLMSDHPLVAQLNAENLKELKGYMENPEGYDAVDGDGIPTGGFTLTGADSFDAAVYLFDLWRSGVRSVEVKQPVLRVTRVTNPLYDAPFYLGNVDKLLTNQTLLSDSGVIPSIGEIAIDLAAACVARTTGDFFRGDSIELRYGWLKDTITCETAGTNRNQYVLEYKFGLWDRKIYGDLI